MVRNMVRTGCAWTTGHRATRTCTPSSRDHMPVRVNPVVSTSVHAHKEPAPQRVTPDYMADVFLTLVLKPNDHGHSLPVELAQLVVVGRRPRMRSSRTGLSRHLK
jgi:hypothetical protein